MVLFVKYLFSLWPPIQSLVMAIMTKFQFPELKKTRDSARMLSRGTRIRCRSAKIQRSWDLLIQKIWNGWRGIGALKWVRNYFNHESRWFMRISMFLFLCCHLQSKYFEELFKPRSINTRTYHIMRNLVPLSRLSHRNGKTFSSLAKKELSSINLWLKRY